MESTCIICCYVDSHGGEGGGAASDPLMCINERAVVVIIGNRAKGQDIQLIS